VVFNKIDQLETEDQFHIQKTRYPNAVPISAQRGDGISELMEKLADHFVSHSVLLNLSIPYTDGKTLDMLYKHGTVLETEYVEAAVLVKARLPSRYLKSVSQFAVKDT